MIKLMDSTRTLTELVNDNTNGLGVIQPVSAYVTEQLNGIYECEFTVSDTEKHYSEIAVGGIVKVTPNETADPQLFRIYSITKPRNGIMTAKARHISYDLNKAAVTPFSTTGAPATVAALVSHMVGTYEFTATTNISNNTSVFNMTAPASFRAALGGTRGSILDTFGGEYEFDNLTVKLLAHRGMDRGVTIEYGKNLVDLTQDENIENTYTAVLGYASTADTTVTGNIQYAVQTTAPKTKIVDFSGDFGDETPTVEEIDRLAQAYIANNNIGTPAVSIRVVFQPLYQTEEYASIAPLERVALGDTVTVKFPKLNVSATARIVAYKYDVNRGKYVSVEIGNVKSNLAATIISMTDQTEKQQSATAFLESYIANFTALVANSLGLFKTVEKAADGSTKVYLHNRPTREDSQYQWTINSNGFFLSTDYGATWSAGIDSEGNAVLNSLAANQIDALSITGSTVSGSQIIFDPDGTPITARTGSYGTSGGVVFEGEGDFTISAATVGIHANGEEGTINAFEIDAYDSNGTPRNYLFMRDDYMYLEHKDSSGNRTAVIWLDENGLGFGDGSVTYRRLHPAITSDGLIAFRQE